MSSAKPKPKSLSELGVLSEDAAINCALMYKDSEKSAEKLYHMQQNLVRYTRLLTVASLASAGVAGLLGYYQYAKLYRVWRLRNAAKVQQYFHGSVACGGFAVTSLLFLVSPVGFMAKHEHNEVQAKRFDRLAFESLTLKQHFASLHAFCVVKETEAWGGGWLARFTSAPARAGTPGIALRRTLLCVDDAAYTEVVVERNRDGDSGDLEEGTGQVGEPSEPTPQASAAARTVAKEKAALAAELLVPETDRSSKGGRASGGASKQPQKTRLSGKSAGEAAVVPGHRHAVVERYTISSTNDELWACYDALSEEWERIAQAQSTLAGEAL